MTLILVPYRNREEHLNIFIEKLGPILKKYITDVKIVIIEQSQDNKKFNRGKILNVGFNEYYKNIVNFYNNKDYDILRIHSGHPTSLGGVIKFKCETFKNINGFPNNIWGWGLEDEALFTRAMLNNCNISNYTDLNISKNYFKFLPHVSSFRNKNYQNDIYNNHFETNSSCIWRWQTDINPDNLTNERKNDILLTNGINDITYEIINKEVINNYIEKILVKI